MAMKRTRLSLQLNICKYIDLLSEVVLHNPSLLLKCVVDVTVRVDAEGSVELSVHDCRTGTSC